MFSVEGWAGRMCRALIVRHWDRGGGVGEEGGS